MARSREERLAGVNAADLAFLKAHEALERAYPRRELPEALERALTAALDEVLNNSKS